MTTLDYDIPLFFTSEDTQFKNLIREQGSSVSKNKISRTCILESLQTFNFGYLILSRIPKIDKNHSDFILLKGYVLFNIRPNDIEIEGKTVCARTEYPEIRLQLLESVKSYVIGNRILKWSIFSKNDPKIFKLYEKFGFNIQDQSENIVQLSINFDYGNKNY